MCRYRYPLIRQQHTRLVAKRGLAGAELFSNYLCKGLLMMGRGGKPAKHKPATMYFNREIRGIQRRNITRYDVRRRCAAIESF